MEIKPLKRFGQNYLRDRNILNKIVDEINPQPDDIIIEIGPGLGALTEELINKTDKFYAVEIDNRAAEILKQKFKNFNLINNDFLKTDLESFTSGKNKLRITGNIPYNLTSPIIFKMIDNHEIIKDSVLMVQYEVAKRMTADKNSKDYGILSVLLNYFGNVKLCFKVSPNVFYPKPKVFSAVVHIRFNENTTSEKEKKFFIMIVKASFGNRRKTLKNSLSNSIFKDINFSETGVDLSLRAEQLELNDFKELADYARKKIPQLFS